MASRLKFFMGRPYSSSTSIGAEDGFALKSSFSRICLWHVEDETLPRAWPIAFETAPELRRSALGAAVGEPVPLTPLPLPRKALGMAGLLLAVKGVLLVFWGWRDPSRLLGLLLFACAAVAMEVTGACFFFRTIRRGLLALHERGFAVGWPGRERAVRFAGIRSLAIAEREVFHGGLTAAVLRRLTVQSDGSTLRFGHEAFDGRPDRITPVLRELLLRLTAEAEERLRGGEALTGKGWSLTADRFLPRRGLPVALSEIAGVAVVQDRLRIWRHGEVRPFFTLPAGSPNAHLLAELLARRRTGASAALPSPLGRFLFTVREPAAAFLCGGLCLLALAFTAFWLQDGGGIAGTALGAFAAALLAALTVALDRRRVEVYEDGVAAVGFRGRREMLFADVETMKVVLPPQADLQVTYAGPLRAATPGSRPARITVRLGISREHLHRFVARPAAAAADKMARSATASGIPWVRGVRITPEGIGKSELIRFADKPRLEITKGLFRLYRRGETNPALAIHTATWGFFPGLALVERRYPTGLL
jgi:hypothetical protein